MVYISAEAHKRPRLIAARREQPMGEVVERLGEDVCNEIDVPRLLYRSTISRNLPFTATRSASATWPRVAAIMSRLMVRMIPVTTEG